jgi:acetyltransferase-like isoleucine patch superfamily enzyme
VVQPPPLRVLISSARCWISLRARGVRVTSVRCDGRPPVLYTDGGAITIGPRLSVRGRTTRAELGTRHRGTLTLGREVYLNQGASVVACERITIGDRVRIGDHAAIHDSDYHPVSADLPLRVRPIVIEDDVWIGRGAIIMPGVEVGRGSVVAAGAVVTRSMPERSLAAGVPARVIRELDVPHGWRRD